MPHRAAFGMLAIVAFAIVACTDGSQPLSPADSDIAEARSIGGHQQLADWVVPRLMFDCREFNAWAAPMTYGPWYLIAEHMGVVNYRGEVWPEGETALFGRIRYYGEESWVEKDFVDDFDITTGDCYSTVKTRFKGVPFGTDVNGLLCY